MSGYTSPRLPRVPLTSALDATVIGGVERGRGHMPRDFRAHPVGFCASRFALPIIPRGEREQRIRERDAQQITNRDLKRSAGITSLDQERTNYCWANAPVQALHYLQAKRSSTIRRLSPASVAAQVKGFRNVGGWGTQAVAWMIEYGVNQVDEWPANAIDRRYRTEENAAAARMNSVTEWIDLDPGDQDQLDTLLLNGMCVAVGLDRLSHEILYIDLAMQDGKFVYVYDNSWSEQWGDRGLGLLSYSGGRPDDAVCPTDIILR